MAPDPCVQCGGKNYTVVLTSTVQFTERAATFELLQCQTCHLVKTEPQLSGLALSAFYSADYYGRVRPDNLDWVRRDQRHKVNFLEAYLQQGRVLDVGCGLGIFLLALDPSRWDRFGLEAMPTPHKEASTRLGADKVAQAELETAPWPEQHFDAITFWDVIEHVPNPRKTLATAFRLLRPGGFLLLTTPNFGGYQARRFGEDWYSLSLPHHFYHYTPATMTSLLEAAGFRVRSLKDRFGPENYHALKHSFLKSYTRRHGPKAGRLRYYLLKPLLHPWEWLSTRLGGGSHLAICVQRPKSP